MPSQAAAAYIGVGLSSLYGLANTNQIDSFTSGRRRLFVTASLDAYIERRRTAEGGSFKPQKLPWQRQERTPHRRLTRSADHKNSRLIQGKTEVLPER